jgi:hypothetical protein
LIKDGAGVTDVGCAATGEGSGKGDDVEDPPPVV